MIFCTFVIHFTTNISVCITKVKCRLAEFVFSQRFKAKIFAFFTQRNGLFPNSKGWISVCIFHSKNDFGTGLPSVEALFHDNPIAGNKFHVKLHRRGMPLIFFRAFHNGNPAGRRSFGKRMQFPFFVFPKCLHNSAEYCIFPLSTQL